MKLLVPVKHVASLRDDLERDSADAPSFDALSPQTLRWSPNEWDAFALEAALALRDDAGGGEVLVATVGAEHAEESLRAGLAAGADRAVRVWDESFASAETRGGLDPLSVARVLAALAERERPDANLCGAQSSDAAAAATGVALAGLLDLAHVAVVTQIDCDGERLTVERELDRGASELLTLELPALLTIQTGANRPRHPNLRAIKHARELPIATPSLDELALDRATLARLAGSRTVGLRERERSTRAAPIDGTPAEIAAQIATIVERALSA
jgi:electron transfer flavoprotein beta subunit